MQRLAPLAIGFLVAVAAILRCGEGAGPDEIVALDGRASGRGQLVFTKAEVVATADFIRAPGGRPL